MTPLREILVTCWPSAMPVDKQGVSDMDKEEQEVLRVLSLVPICKMLFTSSNQELTKFTFPLEEINSVPAARLYKIECQIFLALPRQHKFEYQSLSHS